MGKRDFAGAREIRTANCLLEFRGASSDGLILEGYASVFDAPYDIYGGPPFGFTEVVSKSAFNRTLSGNPDVHLLVNHEGLPLARTKSGTLQLSTDNHGLKVRATLDPSDPDVQRLQPKMARGDMDEMSFAFRVPKGGDSWDDDENVRTLNEVNIDHGDVSVVNFGANPATSSSISRAIHQLMEADEEALLQLRAVDDGDAIRKLHELTTKLLRDQKKPTVQTGRRLVAALEQLRSEGREEFRGAVPVHHTATADGTWDGPMNEARLHAGDTAAFRAAYAWFETGGDLTLKSSWKFPHHNVAGNGSVGAANLNGVRNALSRLPQAKIPDADRAGVKAHLQAHLDDAEGESSPDDEGSGDTGN